MSNKTYITNTYGIIIPSDSENYTYVLNRLMEKHPDYFNDGQDEFEHLYYINDIEPNITHEHNVISLDIERINGSFLSRTGSNVNVLILHGKHEKPTLVASPFKSNDECINHYKNQFDNILPTDFDYERNIGKIYVKAWN